MPEQKLLNYQEVLEKTQNNRAILLGNGFSMAYDKNRFSFTSLLKSAIKNNIIQENGPIHNAFKGLATSDFESVIKTIEDTNVILKAYSKQEIPELKTDALKLKKHLVAVITNNHPEKCTDISLKEYTACKNFISSYPLIYTLNYDLLLYWVVVKMVKEEGYKLDDGFCAPASEENYVVYSNDSGHSFALHHLHGGLHLFKKDADTAKLTFSKTDIPLTTQIENNLNKNKYPIFISEGTSIQKEKKITENPYLNHCFRSLKKLQRDLIIFGTGLKMNDEHIKKAIIDSDCPRIFIGVSSLSGISAWALFEKDFLKKEVLLGRGRGKEKEKIKREIYYYDYNTVDVWGKNDKTTK